MGWGVRMEMEQSAMLSMPLEVLKIRMEPKKRPTPIRLFFFVWDSRG